VQQSAVEVDAETGKQDPQYGALKRELDRQRLVPLWEVYDKVVTKQPARRLRPHIWRWQDYSYPLSMAEGAVKGRDADHRVLVLAHPDNQGKFGSSTHLVAAVQCVLPGERTTPHRHTPSAVRLVLEGAGGATFVDGQRCDMFDGDVIITPNWTWHGHHNDSDRKIVWLDLLDVPLVGAMNNVFGEYGPPAQYPVNAGTIPDAVYRQGGLLPQTAIGATSYSPRFRYANAEVEETLRHAPARPDGSKVIKYVSPLDGRPVVPTIEVETVQLPGGKRTQRFRSSAAFLIVVVAGKGESRFEDETIRWSQRDILSVPEWTWIEHQADGDGARLFVVSDRPVRAAFDFLREEWSQQ
jgi:gentisate 1,2-dioxygenase